MWPPKNISFSDLLELHSSYSQLRNAIFIKADNVLYTDLRISVDPLEEIKWPFPNICIRNNHSFYHGYRDPSGIPKYLQCDFTDDYSRFRLVDLQSDPITHWPMTFFLTIMKLITCQNIRLIDNAPPLNVNKKRIKAGKLPLITYKTIQLFNSRSINTSAKNIWHNRIHLCRGHFKEYPENNKLFGRLTGRFWWQPMVRGQNKKGIIVKDYKI